MEREESYETGNKDNKRNSSSSKDDSLTDFKSPKIEIVAASSKAKIVNDKKTKKPSSKEKSSASNRKKEGSASGRQLQNGKAQPSIESSFFKAANTGKIDGHTCPLCMRYFEDAYAGTTHTKNCASRNNVSTTKLLAAVALQERQADERLAIGLPAGPILQAKDKNPRRNRAAASKCDPDLQLALALSKSLQENKVEQELEQAFLLAAEHPGDERIAGMTDSQRRKTLKNFGFMTNKPISGVPMKPRRKKHLGPTILQTRTQESRDRLLTERIAEILMGNEAITQVCPQKSTAEVGNIKKRPVVLKSRMLNEIHQTTKRLWNSAQLSKGVTNFYVADLGAVVAPVVDRQQKEEKEKGERKDPANLNEKNTDSKADSPRVSNEFPMEANNKVTEITVHSPNNQINQDEDPVESTKNIYVTDRQYRNSLLMDWANTLNVSSMSDVVVLVENNHIWAHKLVFHVRCSNILLDCQPINDTKFPHVKEKISWLDVDYLTALAFLEFVYSGVIVKNEHIFTDDRIAGSVRSLARKYRLKNLFEYMRKRKSEVDRRSEELEGRRSGLRSPIIIEVDRRNRAVENIPDTPTVTVESKEEPGPSVSSPYIKSATVDLTNPFSPKTSVLDVQTIEEDIQSIDTQSTDNISVASTQRCSMSPDIFDETTEEAMEDAETNSPENVEASAQVSTNENSNLNVLAQLIAEDNLSWSSESNDNDTSSMASTIIADKQSEETPTVEKTKEYSSFSQGQLETPKSRSVSFSTDKNIKDRSRTQRLPEKQKSNLSIFIEKVKKINAKSVLDSFTADESLGEPYDRARFRNPFNINNESNKSIFNGINEIITEGGQRLDEKEALSAFEKELLLQHEKKENRIDLTSADESAIINDSFSMAPSDVEDSNIVDSAMSTDDENMSMYSKYKKTHKHNNSINKHRSLLIKLTEASTAASEDDDKSDYFTPLNEEAPIDLTQESDSEVESSPYFNVVRSNRQRSSNRAIISDSNDSLLSGERGGRKEESSTVANRNNSIVSNDDAADESFEKAESVTPVSTRAIAQVRSNIITSPVASSSDHRKNLITTPEYPDLHLYEDNEIFTQSPKNRRTLTPSPKHSDAPNECVSRRCKRRFDESRAKGTSFADNLEKDEEVSQYCDKKSLKGTTSLSHCSQYPELDVFEVDEHIFTQSFRSPQLSPRRTLTPSPKPISETSSRKRRIDEREAENKRQEREDKSFIDGSEKDEEEEAAKSRRSSPNYSDFDVFEVNDHIFTQSFNSPQVSPSRTLTPLPSYGATNEDDSGRNDKLRVPSPIFILSSPDMDVDTDKRVTNIKDTNKENSFLATETNVSPFYSKRNTVSPSNLEEPQTPKPGPSRRRFSPDYGRVSQSPARNSLVRWNSMPADTSNTQSHLKRMRTPTKSPRLVLSQGVTPRVDYDAMDTPELKRELEKYGIKPQKAHRARQLLTHIYNELHPAIPTTGSDLALSDDDEPPAKKIGRSNSQTSDESESESVTSTVSVIPEEMEFPDAGTASNESDDSSNKSSIKQAFTALIEGDKELHNKLLTYEPLSLEMLLLMLKTRGFKCKVNDLMNFLDGECITFQVHDQARRHKSRRARGKKNCCKRN